MHLRIAAIQLDYQPNIKTDSAKYSLGELLTPSDPLAELEPSLANSYLSTLKTVKEYRDVCEKLLYESRKAYVANLETKLLEILNSCLLNSVDLVVFPEYAIPIELSKVLRRFSSKMAIVAGIGIIQRMDLDTLRQLDIENLSSVQIGNNLALLLSPTRNLAVSKKNFAHNEELLEGSGPIIEKIKFDKGEFTVGVGICLDFIREQSFFLNTPLDIAIIPALSRNTAEFTEETPRDFVRVFSNHSFYGGTYIGVPSIRKSLGFANLNGTLPIPEKQEGIVILDWDYKNPYSTRPSRTSPPNHQLYAMSEIVYSGQSPELNRFFRQIPALLSGQNLQIDDLLEHIKSLYRDTGLERYKLLNTALEKIKDSYETLRDDEISALLKHCILSESILGLYEWKYQQCVTVAAKLKALQDNINEPDNLAIPYANYEKTARLMATYSIRVNLLQNRHKGPSISDKLNDETNEQFVFFARLGNYNENASGSLPRQLTVLKSIADLSDSNLKLRYRLETFHGPNNTIQLGYNVVCSTFDRTPQEIETLREGLGQLIHIAFHGTYAVHYTTGEAGLKLLKRELLRKYKFCVEIRLSDSPDNDQMMSIPDWPLIIDLLRSLRHTVSLEMECKALPNQQEAQRAEFSNLDGFDEETLSRMVLLFESQTQRNVEIGRMFAELTKRERTDNRRLSLRIFINSDEPLPNSIISAIGIEIAGANQFRLLETEEQSAKSTSGIGLKPAQVLSIFHPPFGQIYRTAGQRRSSLSIATEESDFPSGVTIGKAILRQVRSDDEMNVRLSEDDRLRHLYVIGKTGVGKTNLLKSMAAQDVKAPGRGVTIIDPHGDLVDYVLREIPEERVNEVTFIDLARTDALPILNPLDFGVNKADIDSTIKDRTIQELIMIMRARVFHEYTGPRFEEIVRAVFETMLDENYPEPASFIELPRILMDRDLQRDLRHILKDKELKKRWDFQNTLATDHDYGSLIHWVTAKFTDISRDSTLRCVMGGAKSTVNVEKIVKQGGILLVRIPEAVIGKQAADFIGSLILLQLRMAIIRRREFGKFQQHHFVYVDEFQNFANTDFHTLVAEARKFNIGFTLAHQNLEQLREFRTFTGVHEERLIGAILGNVGNLIAFSVGAIDAEFLSHHFNVSSANIMRIGKYEALAKVLNNGFDTSAFTLQTTEAPRLESPRVVEAIIKKMYDGYWVSKPEVLSEIDGRIDRIIQKAKDVKESVASQVKNTLATNLDSINKNTNTAQAESQNNLQPETNVSDDEHAYDPEDIFDEIATTQIDLMKTFVQEKNGENLSDEQIDDAANQLFSAMINPIVETMKTIVKEKYGDSLSSEELEEEAKQLFVEFNMVFASRLQDSLTDKQLIEMNYLADEEQEISKLIEFALGAIPDFQETMAQLMLNFKTDYLQRPIDRPDDSPDSSSETKEV